MRLERTRWSRKLSTVSSIDVMVMAETSGAQNRLVAAGELLPRIHHRGRISRRSCCEYLTKTKKGGDLVELCNFRRKAVARRHVRDSYVFKNKNQGEAT